MCFKKIIASSLALGMSLSLLACAGGQSQNATTPTQNEASAPETSEESEANTATDKAEEANAESGITLVENWDFSGGIVPSLNPSVSPNYGSIYWGRNFYNTLVSYDANGQIVGELAESWDISEDGKSYTFHLRKDVKFSDGSAFTADAVKTSFEAAIFNLGSYSGSYGLLTALLGDIEIVDAHTLIINLSQPYYGTLNDLSMSCPMAIINPAAFEGTADLTYGDAFKSASYGTGPYMYAGDHSENSYTFVRNPNYWREAPEVATFTVKVIEDNDAKLLALRNGEIDAILGNNSISFDGYAELSNEASFGTGIDSKSAATRYLGMNVLTPPFDDVLVRQAVAHAIDQTALETSVFNGFETAAKTLFEESLPYCNVAQTIYETDLNKAAALLDEAGWIDSNADGIREKDGKPFQVDLNYISTMASLDNAALAIASQLAQVGIKVNVVAGDMMTYYASMESSPLLLANTYGGAYDPSAFVTNIDPDFSTDPLTVKYVGFLKEGLLKELNSSADPDRVQAIYTDIFTTIADQALLVPLTRTHELGIWNKEKISNLTFYLDPKYKKVDDIKLP